MSRNKYSTPKKNSSWFKKGHIPWSRGLTKETDPRVAKISEKQKGKKKPEGFGEKIRKTRIGTSQTKESNEKRSKSLQGRKKPKGFGEKVSKALRGRQFSKDWIKKNSEGVIRAWQNPEYVKKQIQSRGVKPNKTEKFFENILSKLLPNQYKYVGNGEFILGGKCPDFVNVNGQKKIIELFGDYWHSEEVQGVPKEQHVQDRIDLFTLYGYQTLIIWERELEYLDLLKSKILEFHKK